MLRKVTEGGISRLGAVLHVGAGSCRELEDYLRLRPAQVVLVEAHPELAASLRARTAAVPYVEVLDSAVSAEGSALLRILNNPLESTLLRPTELLDRLPNLRVMRELPVPVAALGDLIGKLAHLPARHNLLVLEAQGAEAALLSSVPAEALQAFQWIVVRASLDSLYEDGATLEQVEALLQRAGFKCAMRPGTLDLIPSDAVLFQAYAQEERARAAANERDAQARLADRQAEQIARLEGERNELEFRLKLMDRELLKAESQLTVIKDLLLDEKPR